MFLKKLIISVEIVAASVAFVLLCLNLPNQMGRWRAQIVLTVQTQIENLDDQYRLRADIVRPQSQKVVQTRFIQSAMDSVQFLSAAS